MAAKHDSEPLLIVVLSGSTGRTASELIHSALAQFKAPDVRIVKKTGVRSAAKAARIVKEITSERAVILHSLVSPGVRDAVLEESQRRLIPAIDVLGPILAVLSDQLGRPPRGKPGLSYQKQKDHIDRIDAVSYTLDHDDGAGMATLHEADVVLVGVSRASKSVTCFYLGYRGIRAANVPLVAGIEPPDELLAMPTNKVIGLLISAQRLQSVRRARHHRLGTGTAEHYLGIEQISEELRYAQRVMSEQGWHTIDVSYMAVEEVAMQIIQWIGAA